MQYNLYIYISYDIYVALVSLVACLGPSNTDFHNEALNFFSSSQINANCLKNDLPATILSYFFN